MKTKFTLATLALVATIISYVFTRKLEDCPAGCITTQGGFPLNTINKDLNLDYVFVLLNFILWFSFFWVGLKLYRRIVRQ